jgi:LDH2 family malate/lactate/ureidoglycolate dehydrogenase
MHLYQRAKGKAMKLACTCVLAAAVLLPAHATLAQDRTQTQSQDRTQTQTRQTIRDRDIYGSQLMTRQERNEYRARMRAANTAEERERIRAEHHERMKERAQAQGLKLPDEPPARSGAGGTFGPGGGMGGGRGR